MNPLNYDALPKETARLLKTVKKSPTEYLNEHAGKMEALHSDQAQHIIGYVIDQFERLIRKDFLPDGLNEHERGRLAAYRDVMYHWSVFIADYYQKLANEV